MKKIFTLFALFAFVGLSVEAQSVDDYIEIARDVLKTEKKAAVAEAMQLTEAESTVFWPLYNEYNAKVNVVQDKRVAIIKEYAKNFDNLTDLKADDLWTRAMQVKQELLKLQKSYYKKFKKILPAGKAARYFQTENKIETLIDAQLALEIPLIETK
jgi:hypothetical protein